MQKIKCEKGITLIVLALTVMVLGIISIPTTLKVSSILRLNKIAKFKDDFTIINETVSQVYPQGADLSSIGPGANYDYLSEDFRNSINPNDCRDYRIIDMNKLSNDLYNKVGTTVEILNFGKSNYDLYTYDDDVYIIDISSRTVYYVAGFCDANGNIIYKYPGAYTYIEDEDFKD